MKLFINTKYKLSEKQLTDLNIKENNVIIQLDCCNPKYVFELLESIKINNKLFDDIKEYLNTYKEINANSDFLLKIVLLYFVGGIIINSNILLKNMCFIEEIYEKYDICVVKSCVNNNIFSGFMKIKKENEVLLNIINTYLKDPKVDLNMLCLNTINENTSCKVLNEKIILDKSEIYYNNNVIAEHYFGATIILEKIKFVKPVKTKKKIGITINVPSSIKDFYSNGIQQNCIYLYELLQNIEDYDIKLLIETNSNVSVFKEIDFYNFEYIFLDNVFAYEFDVIFSMGVSFTHCLNVSLKNTGVKLIYYMCGNNYLIDSEKILYSQHKNRTISYTNEINYDQIWCIPQMYKQNKHYCEIIQKTQCIQVPFIWSPTSIKFMTKITQLTDDSSLYYKKKEGKIGIFEPNMSVMKWSLPCLLIAEKTHRMYNNIKHVYVTNLNKGSENKINSDLKECLSSISSK